MARITSEEHQRRKELLASLIREYKQKNPGKELSANRANDMLYSRVNARMNYNTVKDVLNSVEVQPVVRREPSRTPPSQQAAGETVKVNLRDGREIYVVVLE